jgi:hypothetical protein
MYDDESIAAIVIDAGFKIVDFNKSPSRSFRDGDDSIHLVALKAIV